MVSTLSVPTPAAPARSAPTRLRVPDLLNAVDQAADGLLSGHYDHLLPADGVPTDDRWYTRIHGDDELDVWLIGWVHDVVWAPTHSLTVAAPTLSVHAYSPPLTAMSYYEVTTRNTLRRNRTELTEGPEG